MRRIAVVVAVVVIALVALLGVRLWVQARARNAPPGGSGEIEGTTVDVSARISARVLKLVAVKGRPVKAGDVLVELDPSDALYPLAQATADYDRTVRRVRGSLATTEATAAQT
ncbi:MAG: biotin/lipoyl-binding protein, partial [Deltaproteobacteria bacterium]